MQVKIDNDAFKRGLTEIEESDNEEEDESSNLSEDISDLSSQTDNEGQFFMQQPSGFVMGFDYLPKISRQKLAFVTLNKKRSRSGPRLSHELKNSNLPLIKDYIKTEIRRSINSSPIDEPHLISTVDKRRSKKRVHRTLRSLSPNISSEDEEGSFKASSRIKKSKMHSSHRKNRSGYSTTKFEESGASFSKQLQYKTRKLDSSS